MAFTSGRIGTLLAAMNVAVILHGALVVSAILTTATLTTALVCALNMKDDWERFKNFTLYKAYVTDREMADLMPVYGAFIIIFLLLIGIIWLCS